MTDGEKPPEFTAAAAFLETPCLRWLKRRLSRRRYGRLADEVWPRLPEDARRLVDSMYAGEPQPSTDGKEHRVDPVMGISRLSAGYFFSLVERLKPDTTIEIGMSYGFSTVFLLAALQKGGGGRLISIDPAQDPGEQGVGGTHAKTLGMQDRFTWIAERSDDALVRLIGDGVRAQLVFIDGMHTFDAALSDFGLASRLCDVDGVIVFDDMWMRPIRKVVRFIEKNRADFAREPAPHNLAAFRKVAAKDDRAWYFHRRF